MWSPDLGYDNNQVDQSNKLKVKEGEMEAAIVAAGYESYFLPMDISTDDSDMEKHKQQVEEEKEEWRIALELRRKKQRDVKRRSRARQKNYVTTMWEEVRALEAKYTQLTNTRATAQSNTQDLNPVNTLLQKYTQARTEMEVLRDEIAQIKQRIATYERFEAIIHNSQEQSMFTSSTRMPTEVLSNSIQDDTPAFTLLSEEAYLRIMCNCYLEIFGHHSKGEQTSSSHPIVGWTDERYTDGSNFRFALSKSFTDREAKPLMEKTWELSILEEHMKTLHASTAGMRILQVISDDAVVLERTLNHHYYLDTIVRLNFLVFRFQIENGYLIVYTKLSNNNSDGKQPAATFSISSDLKNVLGTTLDEKHPTMAQSDADKIKNWIDVVLWFRFEETLVDEMMECNVTYGGTLFNTDLQYANFFLVEIMTMLVRWDQAIVQPYFSFFDHEDVIGNQTNL